ncbi:hypothetical protein [Microcoleus sp.]|uniref:hypothetical protein n=1 Tax=Microcoleus sp. TaxID=44472 RepID=UPI00403E45E6
MSALLLARGIGLIEHHNSSGRQILLFPNFSMLGSHDDSRYLANSPIAFQLFQNLKSGQIRHHNALEKLRTVAQKAADRNFSTLLAASIAVQ